MQWRTGGMPGETYLQVRHERWWKGWGGGSSEDEVHVVMFEYGSDKSLDLCVDGKAESMVTLAGAQTLYREAIMTTLYKNKWCRNSPTKLPECNTKLPEYSRSCNGRTVLDRKGWNSFHQTRLQRSCSPDEITKQRYFAHQSTLDRGSNTQASDQDQQFLPLRLHTYPDGKLCRENTESFVDMDWQMH